MTAAVAGQSVQAFVVAEATYNTHLVIAGTDAVGFSDFDIQPSKTFLESNEHTGSSSLETEILGKEGGTWSMTCPIKPGAVGVAPDTGPLLKAAFSTETIVGGTSVAYVLDSTVAEASLQLVRTDGALLYEVINGAWIETVEFNVEGGGLPTMKFSGGFAGYGFLKGNPTTDGSAYASTVTTVVLAAADAYKIKAGARIEWSEDNNGGAGYEVTAVAADGITLTISPGLVTGLTAAAHETEPTVPSATLTGTTIGAVECDLSIDSTSIGFISANIKMDTGIHGLDKEADQKASTCVVGGKRIVEGEMEFYFRDATSHLDGQAWLGNTSDIALRIGPNTAANKLTLNVDAARIGTMKPSVPEDDEITFSVDFKARKNAADDDEFDIIFD